MAEYRHRGRSRLRIAGVVLMKSCLWDDALMGLAIGLLCATIALAFLH